MHGHKNIPSANPLFSGIIMSSPHILHVSRIRVKRDVALVLQTDRQTERLPVIRYIYSLLENNARKLYNVRNSRSDIITW